jgi:hypothetical protein
MGHRVVMCLCFAAAFVDIIGNDDAFAIYYNPARGSAHSSPGTREKQRRGGGMAEIIWPEVTGVITDTPEELLTDEKHGLKAEIKPPHPA